MNRMKSLKICAVFAILAGFLAAGLVISGCGDTDADVASKNLSTEAEQFKVPRRVVFYNSITDKIMETVEGYCSVETPEYAAKLEVTCKVIPPDGGEAKYFKEFLGLSDNVTYMTQQLEPLAVSTSHYKVVLKPSTLIPDIEIP
jgi:hypothetical protein